MKKLHGAMVMGAALAISGCQSFPMHFGMKQNVEAAEPDMSSYFAQRLNDGRMHLRAQRPGAAVDAFRQASYDPSVAGEAYNGMAIAYDQMGRYDLAERFFAQAMEAAPEDQRFARNAARFETTMLARQQAQTPVQMANENAATPTTELTATLASIAEELDAQVGEMPQERLQRVSSREVQIASRDDWTARAQTSPTARPAVMHVGRDAVLAELNPANMDEPGYPVRIALAAVPVAQQHVPAQTQQEADTSRFVDESGATVRVRVSGNLIPRERPAYPIRMALDSPS